MSVFGFTFKALYRLEVDELWEVARLIKGQDHYLPKDKEVLIRGVLIPFFRKVTKTPKDADKEQVMRNALIQTAQNLSIECDNWETARSTWLAGKIRQKWTQIFRKHIENLSTDELESILKEADDNLKQRAKQLGLSLIPTTGIVAGELSGFGIYMATTTGLGALSSAIGVTFPWAVYQGATTVLGVILGPIGWVLAGTTVILGGMAFWRQWFKREKHKLAVVVIALIISIGNNPYEWFGLPETASFSEVKQVYRAMMKTFHPDVIQENLPEWLKHRFNELLLQTQENYKMIERYLMERGDVI
ncbi:MAG: J domain-containing protein [Methanobacteriota archaeon]|nr:MAG: J domain-containing protein [Euryarchaeota archaeon]